jgi:holo-[acyl-carrier protein] synthase
MLGIGVDIIDMNRMAETMHRSGDLFLKRAFSPVEIQTGKQSENPIAFYATAFAAKEAVFKALTLSWKLGIDLRDIEVCRGPFGEPAVKLSGQVERIAREKGVGHVMLSLSYEMDVAIAMVVLVGV